MKLFKINNEIKIIFFKIADNFIMFWLSVLFSGSSSMYSALSNNRPPPHTLKAATRTTPTAHTTVVREVYLVEGEGWAVPSHPPPATQVVKKTHHPMHLIVKVR